MCTVFKNHTKSLILKNCEHFSIEKSSIKKCHKTVNLGGFFEKIVGKRCYQTSQLDKKLIENVNIGKWEIFTMFGNHSKCRNWIFPQIFVLLKVTCLVTLFDHNLKFFQKLTIFGIFKELLPTQNVNLARFARNVECDFFKHCVSWLILARKFKHL